MNLDNDNSKFQISYSKFNDARLEIWNQDLGIRILESGSWNLDFGIWILEFVICNL